MIESLSNSFSVEAGREGIQYRAETLRKQVPELLVVLGDQMRPRLAEWEVRDQRERVASSRAAYLADAVTALSESVHFTAFRGTGLGRPSVAPSFQIDNLTHEALQQYVANEFVGSRIVVAAVGVDHETLATNAAKSFGYLPAGTPQAAASSTYTGGEHLSLGGHGTRVALAFQGVSFTSEEHLAARALSLLLGGGVQAKGSPGDGLTSRLYHALTTNPLLRSAASRAVSYTDTGLFGIQGYAAANGSAAAVTELFAAQLRALKHDVSDEEAARAVAVARASLLASTDTRLGALEFLGKQALAGNGNYVSPAEYASSTRFAVTSADLKRTAAKILSSNPTLVATGDIAGLPTIDRVRQLVSS
mgnify:CR=1 FL=1